MIFFLDKLWLLKVIPSLFFFVKKKLYNIKIYIWYNYLLVSKLKIKDCVVLKNLECSLQLVIS